MPHIRMRGLPQEVVQNLSNTLIDTLAGICKGNVDSFTLEWLPCSAYRRGELDTRFTQVEVLWFPKDPDTHHLVEQAIREAITHAYSSLDTLVVMFFTLTPSAYYRNGHHF